MNTKTSTEQVLALHVICSDEFFLVQEKVDAIRQHARQLGYTEREIHDVTADFKWGHLSASFQSLSLFGDRKIIELRIPSGKPGKEGAEFLKNIAQYLCDDICLIITLPRMDKTSKNSQWFKGLESASSHQIVEIKELSLKDLPQWIGQRLARHQQQVEPETLRWMAENFEGNVLAAHQEIEKLAYLCPTGLISFEEIQKCIFNVSRYNVFDLPEVMLSGNPHRLLVMLEHLEAEGESIVMVVWALSECFRALLSAKSGQDKNLVYRQYRVWGDKQALYNKALAKLSLPLIQRALIRTAELDQISKGLINKNPWAECMIFSSQIAKRMS